jgi:alkylated DNA repair dioxygenase AlkB
MRPNGLVYIRNYIDAAAQDRLLREIDSHIWIYEMKRRVQHYGYRYDYKRRMVTKDAYLGELPTWAQTLGKRLCDDGLIGTLPTQVIVNEYVAGQGISAHVDCVPCFGDTILSLSLGSPCVMDFSHPNGAKHPLLLEVGSLVQMQGEARYVWRHAIPARKVDVWGGENIVRERRVSITLRDVRLHEA